MKYGTVWMDGMGAGMPTGFDPVGVGIVIMVFVVVMTAIIQVARPAICRQIRVE